jgi:hypothetical protein
MAFLRRYISPRFLQGAKLTRLCERFCKRSSVCLDGFLNEKWAALLRTALTVPHHHSTGDGATRQSNSWAPREGIHVDSFQTLLTNISEPPSSTLPYGEGGDAGAGDGEKQGSGHAYTPESLLDHLKRNLLESESFARLLCRLTTLTPLAHRVRVRRFSPGDYQIAHAGTTIYVYHIISYHIIYTWD